MRRIRTGVVGYGLAGRVFHAPFVRAVPELELTAIVQRTGDTAKQAYPDAAQMRSLEELLAKDVELVVIGTPSPTHFALSKQALEAGQHVVCDKPVTTTSAQAEELVEAAQETTQDLLQRLGATPEVQAVVRVSMQATLKVMGRDPRLATSRRYRSSSPGTPWAAPSRWIRALTATVLYPRRERGAKKEKQAACSMT